MNSTFKNILDNVSGFEQNAREMKEILLANLIMLAEIPAPTFNEEERIEFITNRYKEADIQDHSVDEAGNGIGVIEGKEGRKNIVVVAHADTIFTKKINHTIQIQPDKAIGPGVADNSLGLAILATLPMLLKEMQVTFQHNIILVAATQSLGRGNLGGLRSFLANCKKPLHAGLGLEGVQLGRLSHTSIGMKRGEITCKIPDAYDWSRFGDASAILTINEIINSINKIRVPQRPRTSIVLGSVQAGSSFTTAKKAQLNFEIRSESSRMVQEISRDIQEIVTEVSSQSGDTIELDIFAQRRPGGIPFSHPMVRSVRRIMDHLHIDSRPGPSTSELSAFIDQQIPAITLGISQGANFRELNETVRIKPIYKGIAQIIGTLQAIDGGFCEED